ncbi:MAG: multifunctional CCA tRNA nucleotidyl transferase/2'3'-cyclic phosphodiesterase/2'nucleotidase/phosphatase, partial [Chromatocurvus sp.]
LLHDLGKAVTPADVLPRHIGHEKGGLRRVDELCNRIKAPNAHRELALAACEFHLLAHRARELTGKTLLKLLKATGALRPQGHFEAFLAVCEADTRGRLGKEASPYPQADYLRRGRDIARGVTAAAFVEQGLQGKAIGEAIAREQVRRLESLRGDAG